MDVRLSVFVVWLFVLCLFVCRVVRCWMLLVDCCRLVDCRVVGCCALFDVGCWLMFVSCRWVVLGVWLLLCICWCGVVLVR